MTNFKSMKFRVKSWEHSREIQTTLFKLGYRWSTLGDRHSYLEFPSLYTDSSGGIFFGFHGVWFEDQPHEECKVEAGEIVRLLN